MASAAVQSNSNCDYDDAPTAVQNCKAPGTALHIPGDLHSTTDAALGETTTTATSACTSTSALTTPPRQHDAKTSAQHTRPAAQLNNSALAFATPSTSQGSQPPPSDQPRLHDTTRPAAQHTCSAPASTASPSLIRANTSSSATHCTAWDLLHHSQRQLSLTSLDYFDATELHHTSNPRPPRPNTRPQGNNNVRNTLPPALSQYRPSGDTFRAPRYLGGYDAAAGLPAATVTILQDEAAALPAAAAAPGADVVAAAVAPALKRTPYKAFCELWDGGNDVQQSGWSQDLCLLGGSPQRLSCLP